MTHHLRLLQKIWDRLLQDTGVMPILIEDQVVVLLAEERTILSLDHPGEI